MSAAEARRAAAGPGGGGAKMKRGTSPRRFAANERAALVFADDLKSADADFRNAIKRAAAEVGASAEFCSAVFRAADAYSAALNRATITAERIRRGTS